MAETIKKKYKVLMLAPVPFYYQVPLFQKLAESLEIDFMVYYCSDETIHSADIERMYRTKNKFADPENLLKGYHYNFLKNYSLSPSFLSWPCGLVNFGIWKEIKKNKYDAVILQGWNNFTWWLAFLACSMFKTPVLFMTDANVFKKDLKSKSKNFFKKFLFGKLLFKRAAGFLTTSLVNENLYKTYGVPKEKMIELHYSYGYPNFLKKAKELELQRKDIRKSFGIEESEFVLLFVGRLSKEKNILALLAAYKKIDYKNKKLFIVGDGPLRPQIEKYIKDLKIQGVNLKGFQQREYLINFYIVSDALVLPSTDEPWGMVINEAMCFGLPIIASDKVGAAVDLVQDGYNGFIFPSENIEKLADCIEKLINLTANQRQIFGGRSFEIINKWVSSVDPEQQMIKTLELLKNKR